MSERGARAGWLRVSAVYFEAPVVALLTLGFASGLPLALTAGTLAIWLTETGIDLTTIGLFAAVATPYSLKFLWAPLIDHLPLPWLSQRLGRRRGWLLAIQFALIAALVALGGADPARGAGVTALLALLVAFLSASQDIVIDAFRIESLEPRQMGAGAAMYVFGYRLAMLASGAGALYAADAFGWTLAYWLMAGLMAIGVVTTLWRPEPSAQGRPSAPQALAPGRGQALAAWFYHAVIAPFVEFLGRPNWALILLFVMLYKFGDTLAGTMTNPFMVKIGFAKYQIAEIGKIFGFGATLAELAAGGALINGAGLMRSLWLCGILQLASNLMFAVQAVAGADTTVLALTIGFENLAGGMGTAAFVAYLSGLTNIAYTATQYALLTSFMAVARTWLAAPAGWLVEHVDWAAPAVWIKGGALGDALAAQINWVGFFLFTTVAALPGLALLGWLGIAERRHRRPPATAPATGL